MDTEMKPASKFPRWLRLVMGGAACAALTGAAVWYDLTYNGGRLVYPMQIGRASCRERVYEAV